MSIISKEKKEYDYFISYSNMDSKIVEPIITLMEKDYNAKCWFQLHNSKSEYIDEIIKGIEDSCVFIIFVSKNSANSNNVLNEIHYALEWANSHLEYKILPIVIDDGRFDIRLEEYRKIRFYLNRYNMLFFKENDEAHSLVSQIFQQTGFVIDEVSLSESLYHSTEVEAKRLRAQNEILKKAADDIFSELVKPSSVILDVGCASGGNIILRLEGKQYSKLFGVDIDAVQIEKANAQFGNEQNSFSVCDVTSDDLHDLLQDYLERVESTGFDLIHISSVLLHQTEPVKILKALKRYLKTSGHLFIQEEDDGANLVHPNSAFFDRAFAIWLDSRESGDRFCARKIPAYLKESGYKTVSLKKCGIANIDLAPEEQAPFWDIYFNYYLWEALEDEKFFYDYKKTMETVAEYAKDYETRYQEFLDGKIFIQLGFLFFVAKK